MKFGQVPLEEASGGILAHSVKSLSRTLKKGTVLGFEEIDALRDAGHDTVVVARLEPNDVPEDEAARRLGRALVSDGLKLGPAFTGRANLIAERAGVVRVDTVAINAMNLVDEGLTLATLPDLMRVEADQLVATAKIIPYALPDTVVSKGIACLGEVPIRLFPFAGGKVCLIMTETSGFKKSLLLKGEKVIRERLEVYGYELTDVVTVAHDTEAVASALGVSADLVLILGASATSDRADVVPAAVVAAGGRIDRFGMPVDPGNLMLLARLEDTPVVGLPGCARSPAMNGVDWVLERLSARIPVKPEDVAAMGVGGLLKEMPERPQPRRPRT